MRDPSKFFFIQAMDIDAISAETSNMHYTSHIFVVCVALESLVRREGALEYKHNENMSRLRSPSC